MYSFTLPTLVLALASATSAWTSFPPGTTWQIVLSNPLQPPYANKTALDGDLFDTTAGNWSAIKSAGHKTICYFSAGTYENWRSDANKFTEADLGDDVDGWAGERWVDTNSANVRAIMQARMDLAQQRGCDAIDPDNVDAFDNDGGGLGLTEDDAVSYVTFLSQQGHQRGMAVGLKNAADIVPRVLNLTDFQVNEQCQANQNECPSFQPFIAAGKAVFHIEYVSGTPTQATINSICGNPKAGGFSTIIKHMSLDEWVVYC